MDKQRDKQLMNGVFEETMLHKIADMQTYTSIAKNKYFDKEVLRCKRKSVNHHTSIVVMMYVSTVLPTCRRIAKNKCFNKKAGKCKYKPANHRGNIGIKP